MQQLVAEGHYVGVHSDQHLLYCDWQNRDSLLVSEELFSDDLNEAYRKLEEFGVGKSAANVFLPPYEWYNQHIVDWAHGLGLKLVNYSPGTLSTADYTFPEMGDRYRSNEKIMESIINYEQGSEYGLNGFFLLTHLGTEAKRTEKFYMLLPTLIDYLKTKGYGFERMDSLVD